MEPGWKSLGSLYSVRVEQQEGFSSVGCTKLSGRDEVFGVSNPGAESRAAGVGVALNSGKS